jgi:YbgC/YbaW family acyl-CoA thioester hydrolase
MTPSDQPSASFKTYTCPIEVRGYELDSFGHVNHAVYVSYMEHARWVLLREDGITLEKFNQWKRWPVIAKLEAKYMKPTYLGDQLVVESKVQDIAGTSFTVTQDIKRGAQIVFQGKVLVVLVDETGKPASIPTEVGERWKT